MFLQKIPDQLISAFFFNYKCPLRNFKFQTLREKYDKGVYIYSYSDCEPAIFYTENRLFLKYFFTAEIKTFFFYGKRIIVIPPNLYH